MKYHVKSLKVTLFCILLGFPSFFLWANGSLPVASGARNAAMAGAGAAYASDPTGLSINPALGTGLKNELAFAPSYAYLNNPVYGNTSIPVAEESNHVRSIFAVFGAWNYHIKDNLTIGITSFGAGGGSIFESSPVIPGSVHPGTIFQAISLFSVPLSYKVSESLSIGAGPILGILGLRTDASPQSPWQPIEIGLGAGANLGAQLKLNSKFSVGAALQSPIIFQKQNRYSDIISKNIQLPLISTLGIVLHASPTTDILFDVQSAYWSNTSSAGRSPSIPGGSAWKNVNAFKLGAQHQLNQKIAARAGFQYSPSAVVHSDNVYPVNAITPANALTNNFLSLGLGYQMYKTVAFDFTGIYSFKNTITDNGAGYGGPSARGYTISGHAPITLFFQMTWNYGEGLK